MKLYFARHGESEANILREISNRGYRHGLTGKGRRQAATLAANLAGRGVRKIYTSPLQRAVETSQVVAEALGVPFEVTGALREYDCGIAEGRGDAEAWNLQRWLREEWLVRRRLESRIEGGESFLDIQARFRPLIDNLLSGPEEDALLVGHGGLYIYMLPGLLRNIDPDFPFARSFENTAYVLAEKQAGGLVCLEWCGEKVA